MRLEHAEVVRAGTRAWMETALAEAKRRRVFPEVLPGLVKLPVGTVATVVHVYYLGADAAWDDLDRVYAEVKRPASGSGAAQDPNGYGLEDAFDTWDAIVGYGGKGHGSMIIELYVPGDFVITAAPGPGRSRQGAVWWPTTDTWGQPPAPKSRQALPRSQRSWLKPNRASKVDRVFDEVFDVVADEFPDFGDVELYEDNAAGADNGAGAERQFAYCKDGDPMIIAFAPKAETLPLNRLRGLMRHEFGHALEYRYGVKELEQRFGTLPKGIEARADAIAEAVWGDTIVYDDDLVQCVGVDGISPRPRHLPEENTKLKANPAPQGVITVYHGTGKAMEKPAEIKFKADWSGDFGPGLYFATALSDAMTYGSRVYEARIELKNPIVIAGTDEDAALVAWFKKALKITDEDLSFYDNPIAGAFAYFQTLVEVGTYRPDGLVNALKKKGYDGIYVERAAAQKHHDLAPAGDYAVVWSADQILSWEHVDEGQLRATYKAKYDVQRNASRRGDTKRSASRPSSCRGHDGNEP